MNINSWLEDELYQQYLHNHGAVDESWKHVFEDGGNGHGATPRASEKPAPALENGLRTEAPGQELIPLRGAAARIAQNMEASLAIPVATSQRTIPVKV